MASEPNPKPPEIHVDDDWKQRVKAEDAAFDEQFRQPASTTHAAAPAEPDTKDNSAAALDDSTVVLPADFSTLVGMLSTQALVALGVVADPATGKANFEQDIARYFIDLLMVLEEKTKGNLSRNEESLLETTLHQLRMVFVEMTRRPKSEAGPQPAAKETIHQ